MKCSIKNIRHAYEVLDDFDNYVNELKRYAIVSDLKRYGVCIQSTSELELSHLKEVYYIVLKRIVDKYSIDGNIK